MKTSVTLDEVAYNILNLMRGGRSSNNEHISIDQIKFNVKYYRSLLIRRSLERDQNYRKFEQDLGFVDIEVWEESEGVGLTLTNNIARTVDKLPSFLRAVGGPAITFVGPEDKRTRYETVEVFESPYQAYNKYTSGKYRSYLLNDRIYIMNDKGAEAINTLLSGGTPASDDFVNAHSVINVRGIFEDPVQVAEYLGEDEVDLALPMDMVQQITQSIGNGEVKMMAQSESDKETDNLQQP